MAIKLGIVLASVAVVVASSERVAWAQSAPPPTAPTTGSAASSAYETPLPVTVRVNSSARPLRGRLISLGPDALILEVEDHSRNVGPLRTRLHVPLTSVVSVDREERDSWVDGAIVGALFFAACAKWWCGQGTGGPPPNPWVGAGLGAVVGAAIDGALYRRTPIYPLQFGEGAGPRQLALRFRLRF